MNIYRTPFGTWGLNVLNLFLVEPWGNLKPAQKRNPDGKVFRALFWGLWVRVMSPEADIRNITWKDDPAGPIWQGELWKDGRRVFVIGNYYDIDEMGQRDNNAPAHAQPPVKD